MNFHRLHNQQITSPRFNNAEDIVRWMGAIQAQDYAGALWGIGLRLKNKTESDIEKAIAEKKIVRSWPMRGTLHFVAPENLRWMLKFLTPRVIKRSAGIYRQSGLDSKVFARSRKLVIAALRSGGQLTRPEIYEILERAHIVTAQQRGLHILGHLAQESLICFGPRKGKQQAFVLIDEWLSPTPILDWEEGLAKLATTYFTSHGPATLHDFAWWSGLTLTEAKLAITMTGSQLREEIIGGHSYWMSPAAKSPKVSSSVFLLPNFDEYLVAYKDRSAAVNPLYSDQVKKMGNGLFSAPLIIDGVIGGVWKRLAVRDRVRLEITPFESFNEQTKTVIKEAVSKMQHFLQKPIDVKYLAPVKRSRKRIKEE